MAQKDKKIVTLLDVPQGATCVLVGWGSLETQDVKKLTDVGVFLDLPLIVLNVTSSGPIVVAINDAHIAIGANTAKHMQVYLKE
ncbi:FeoA family protein [uncultured Parasutterella sp.]|uniref:FeoA family protein n=1 Tax=uncultured Parasutterella sp. TaxID=1263098 RepID=UPI0034A11C78